MSPEKAYAILSAIAEINGDEDLLVINPLHDDFFAEVRPNEEPLNQTPPELLKRGPFRFSEADIPIGSILQYRSDASIEVTVADDRHISYRGEVTSLSALARKLRGFKYNPQGTLWFMYQGEVLDERRIRLEKERA